MEDSQRFALLELARQCALDQAPLAQERRIELSVDIDPDLLVSADRSLLTRMLGELVGSLVKLTPQGGRVAVHARSEGERVDVAVEFGLGLA